LLFVGAEWDETAQVYRDVLDELGLNSWGKVLFTFTEPSPQIKDDTSPLNQ
jgi:hypothetical protein